MCLYVCLYVFVYVCLCMCVCMCVCVCVLAVFGVIFLGRSIIGNRNKRKVILDFYECCH